MTIVQTGCITCGDTIVHPSEPNDHSMRTLVRTQNLIIMRHVSTDHMIMHFLDEDQDKVVAWCPANDDQRHSTLTYLIMKVVPGVREFVESSFTSEPT